MKAADVLIAWTPAQSAGADLSAKFQGTAGSVAVLAWPQDCEAAEAYARLLGGPDPDWKAASTDMVLNQLRVLFRTLVIRDGLDPDSVHASFLEIDEYRREIFREHAASVAPPTRPRASGPALRRVA